ncbi:MAG: cysteine synthase A [Gammaproteobacteria bacterium]|jgi:cysteine synthase A
MIIDSVLEIIGETPLLNLSKISVENGAVLYGKAEFLNPMGSVKDRPAMAMIEAAEISGELKKGMTIIEATSGNTGIGLAMVAAVKGYKLELYIDKDVSRGICKIAEYMGAKLIESDGFALAVEDAKAKWIGNKNKYYLAGQFDNEENPKIHSKTTAREIIRDVGPRIKAFVASYGSGGSFSGIGTELKKYNNDIQLILVEPKGMSRFSNNNVSCSEIHGIGPSFLPKNMDVDLFDDTIIVNEEQALETVKLLATQLGILCGPSSGAMVHAAIEIASKLNPEDVVITLLPDRGDRYFDGDEFGD